MQIIEGCPTMYASHDLLLAIPEEQRDEVSFEPSLRDIVSVQAVHQKANVIQRGVSSMVIE
jgi:hypothetical protein